jgi:fructose-bisphosphate aldolase class I
LHILWHTSNPTIDTFANLQGLIPFEGHDLATGETSTRGLDSLAAAAAGYRQAGARFAKWRAALRVDAVKGFPSERAVELNAQQLAQYAVVCQAAGRPG